jgi:hypothetical protein
VRLTSSYFSIGPTYRLCVKLPWVWDSLFVYGTLVSSLVCGPFDPLGFSVEEESCSKKLQAQFSRRAGASVLDKW